MQKKNSLLGVLINIIGIFLLLLLVMSYLADIVSPIRNPYVALCGILYPYLLVLNMCVCFLWILNKNRIMFLSLAILVIGLPLMGRYYQYAGVDETGTENEMQLKTMTYNVQLLGVYRDNHIPIQKKYRDSILHIIEDVSPDILCMQEFYQSKDTFFQTTALLNQMYPGYQAYPSINSKQGNYMGNVIYSRYPIINAGNVGESDYLNHKAALFADILVGDDTLRIYNLHLKSVQFQKQDYDFATQLTDVNEDVKESLGEGSRRIMNKLKSAYAVRTIQVDSIIRHMEKSPYKVVVCGDFNDVPWSYTYHQFKKRYSDSFKLSGLGRGNTFVLNKVLRFRIDYIFCDKQLKSRQHTVVKKYASDHFATVAYITTK